MNSKKKNSKKQENGLVNLLFNIAIPSIILIKFSTPEHLGPFYGLIIALAFPVCYGVYDLIIRRDFNVLSLFGFISILLTGIISLVELDKMWIIIKETSIPLLIIVFMLLFNKKGILFFQNTFSEILNSKKIKEKMGNNYEKLWEKYYYIMVIPFMISAILNFSLAYILIKNQPGTVEYTQEIGRMTALSFPVIALPSMIILIFVFYLMFNHIKKSTGLKLDEIIVSEK